MLKLPKIFRTLVTAGGRTPYTFDWDRATEPVAMEIDPACSAVGPLKFGDPIDVARVFGKPDDYHRHEGSACTLFYYGRGFHLGFDSNRRFSFCRFFLSPDTPPPQADIRYTQVSIRNRGAITSRAGAAELVSLLGKTVDECQDSDGALFTFALSALALDVHFNAEGRLVDVDVFPLENHRHTQAGG